jgi:hypothetical protein
MATLACNAIYIPSMKYGLSATSLNMHEIEAIQRYAIDKLLPKMGYSHGTHRALIFGSKIYNGFGVRLPYTEMQGAKSESLISHIQAGSTLGITVRININYWQV